jgi:hypothetical protein
MDKRICIRCKKKADVVEKGKDYCASCYFIVFIGETIESYEKRKNELEERRKKKNESISGL